MQKLGQHFLKNAAILEKIVGALALADGDRVIEIGPGHGELTVPLAQAARKKHCFITCIEKDHALIENLQSFAAQKNSEHADGRPCPLITIMEGDALKLLPVEIKKIVAQADPPRYKIVGNIPYYITGKLLRVMSELGYKPERAVLLVQKEVALRICAAPPAMNRLAASVQFWADAEIVANVPRRDFSPPPEVDSAVIVLKSKNSPLNDGTKSTASTTGAVSAQRSVDPALYYRAVRKIFTQPRKTILNNLSSSTGGSAAKTDIAAQLKKIGIDPAARPQDLGIAQIVAIAHADFWG